MSTVVFNMCRDNADKKCIKIHQLKQKGSVREYAENFQEYYEELDVKPDKGGLGIFYSGLKESIKDRLEHIDLDKLADFDQLLRLALQIEKTKAEEWAKNQANLEAEREARINSTIGSNTISSKVFQIMYIAGYGWIDTRNADKEGKKWMSMYKLEQTGSVHHYASKLNELYESLEDKPAGGISSLIEVFYEGFDDSIKDGLNDVDVTKLKDFDALVQLASDRETDLNNNPSKKLCDYCYQYGHLERECLATSTVPEFFRN